MWSYNISLPCHFITIGHEYRNGRCISGFHPNDGRILGCNTDRSMYLASSDPDIDGVHPSWDKNNPCRTCRWYRH